MHTRSGKLYVVICVHFINAASRGLGLSNSSIGDDDGVRLDYYNSLCLYQT